MTSERCANLGERLPNGYHACGHPEVHAPNGLSLATCAGCPKHSARARQPGQGRKPWEYPIAVALPHRDTPEPLEVAAALLRLQTERPYLIVVDTGSTPANLARLEALRGEDCEVHSLQANAYLHPHENIAVAMDLAQARCDAEFLFCTHTDCFLRRRDALAHFLALCSPSAPVVGYGMSPRPHWGGPELWEWMVGHSATTLHLPTLERHGVRWEFRQFFREHPERKPSMDTEVPFNYRLRAAGMMPLFLGQEKNHERHTDRWIDHARSYTLTRNLPPEQRRGSPWDDPDGRMDAAIEEARQRVARWRKPRAPLGVRARR